MDIKIYVLIDPQTNEYRYVGKTILSLRERLKGHLSQSMRTNTPGHKEYWIRNLLSQMLKPAMKEIEICNEDNWQEREKHWIAFGKEQGWPLTNLSPGGEGWHGPRHNKEFKETLKERMKGNTYGKGVRWTKEQREEMMKSRNKPWNKGRKGVQTFSEKSRQERSKRMSGQKHPMAKLSDGDIIQMRRRYSLGEVPKSIAIDYGINYSHCIKIVTNKIRKVCVPS